MWRVFYVLLQIVNLFARYWIEKDTTSIVLLRRIIVISYTMLYKIASWGAGSVTQLPLPLIMNLSFVNPSGA